MKNLEIKKKEGSVEHIFIDSGSSYNLVLHLDEFSLLITLEVIDSETKRVKKYEKRFTED